MGKFSRFIGQVALFGVGIELLTSPTSHAAITLYDNGPSTHGGGSSIALYIAADDFVLPDDTFIAGASVDVSDGPADENRRWDETVQWWLLDDNGGKPGNVVASGVGRNIRQVDVEESPLGFRDFTVDFDFGRIIPVTGGETYWLALHFQEDYSRLSVSWDFRGDPYQNNPSYSGGDLVMGAPYFADDDISPHDKAFRIIRYDAETCLDGTTADTDGDGLFDCWEIFGIDADGDGTIDLQLYDLDGDGVIEDDPNGDGNTDDTEIADFQHRDIYMEIDWMAQHRPVAGAVDRVVQAFADAPVNNPDGTTGIRLHIQTDEQALAHNDDIAFEPCTDPAAAGIPDFDDVKSDFFGTFAERSDPNGDNILDAKRRVFHYTLFVHNLLGKGLTSGCAELPGNDFVVSLGGYFNAAGNLVEAPTASHWAGLNQHDGTLMHEFGHNLNLRHGGDVNTNCKPNYLSIMSYSRQFEGVPIVGRQLDYSRQVLATLDESNLSEPAGIGGPAGQQTAYGPIPVQVAPADQPIDWSRNADSTDTGVSADINNHGITGCTGAGTVLDGYNDWLNLQYNLRESMDFEDGVHLTTLGTQEEMRLDEALTMSPDTDGDGVTNLVDNCPLAANGDQADSNGNGVGDACEPVADAGMDRTVDCSSPTGTPVQLDGSASYDPDGDSLTFTWRWDGGSAAGVTPTIHLPLGIHTISLVVNDGKVSSEPDTVTIDVVDVIPPQIILPPDVTVECQGSGGQAVDIGAATASDACCGGASIVNDAPSLYFLGVTDVAWTATDCHSNSSSATQRVSIVDSIPPTVAVSVTPEILWPPNHKMVPATVEVESHDICDAAPSCRITAVASNEPVNGLGDGHRSPDWEISGDLTVELRAERSGTGSGRDYAITVECTDSSGNSTAKMVTVTVPHQK